MDASRYPSLLVATGALVIGVGMLAGFALGFELVGWLPPPPAPTRASTSRGRTRLAGGPRGLRDERAAAARCRGGAATARAERRPGPLRDLRARGGGLGRRPFFYVFANFAPNRGLTLGANRFGEATLAGALAYLPAIVAALLVLAVLVLVARGAFAAARRAG